MKSETVNHDLSHREIYIYIYIYIYISYRADRMKDIKSASNKT